MTDDLEDLKHRLVVGHKSDGRSVYDAAAKAQLVALCLQPGASVSRLARECGVNANQVSRWLREHGNGSSMRKAVAGVVSGCSTRRPRDGHASTLAQRGGHRASRRRAAAGGLCDRRLGEAAVFRLDEGLKVYLHREPVDFRLSINGLALLVEQALGLDPFASCAYAFSNRRRDRIKILGWVRNGFWLLMKLLEKDRFIWPSAEAVPTLTVEQLHWLLEGIDIAVVQRHPHLRYGSVA